MSFLKHLFGTKQEKPPSPSQTSTPLGHSHSAALQRTEVRTTQDKPEHRVCDYSGGDVEAFYAKMSRDLVSLHGPLKRVEYLEHFPTFRIRFIYEDGAVIRSDERSGRYDIHFLSLGYVGEGPRYTKAFLAAAGVDLSTNEIERVAPGDVLTALSATEERFVKPDAGQDSYQQRTRTPRCRLGATEELSDKILSMSPPVLSPDGSVLAILRARTRSEATIEMLDGKSHSLRWSVELPSFDSEIAFMAADRLLAISGESDSHSTIQLLDVADGSIIETAAAPGLTHSGTHMGWVSGKRLYADPERNMAAREFKGERIVLIRIRDQRLELSETKVPQVHAEGPRIGPDGECYFISHFGLYHLTGSGPEKVVDVGDHCICSDRQGRIYCGSGYSDMSGEAYLHIVDLKTKQAKSVLLGREPIHRIDLAGDGQLLASSIVERSRYRNRDHAWIAALDVSGQECHILWERRIEGLAWGRVPVILTEPEEGWGLLQTRHQLQLIGLASGDALGELGKHVDEVCLGAWAPSRRMAYIARFPDWAEQGTLHSVEIQEG